MYCADRGEINIECIELKSNMAHTIETSGAVHNLFSHNKELYADIGSKIHRYEPTIEEYAEEWIEVTYFPEDILYTL